jgi:hypothetical protein
MISNQSQVGFLVNVVVMGNAQSDADAQVREAVESIG